MTHTSLWSTLDALIKATKVQLSENVKTAVLFQHRAMKARDILMKAFIMTIPWLNKPSANQTGTKGQKTKDKEKHCVHIKIAGPS